MDDRDVDASEITVEVVNSEVTLSGTVDDRWQKRRAEDIADAVTGVTEVANNIRLSRQERGQDSHVMSGQGTSGLRSSSSPASGSSEATNPTTSAV
jgi:Flp pilus assembly secretin CpaC